jgi:hypothetical protein
LVCGFFGVRVFEISSLKRVGYTLGDSKGFMADDDWECKGVFGFGLGFGNGFGLRNDWIGPVKYYQRGYKGI